MIVKSDRYKRIGQKLVADLEEFEDIRDVRIAYLSSDKAKKNGPKLVLADCTKVNERYEWTCPYDFMITVYEPNTVQLNRAQLRTLIRHELHHIGINYDAVEPQFYIVPHDIEDFDVIINDVGLHWER